MQTITGALLRKVFTTTPLETLDAVAAELNAQGPAWSINTPRRMAAFIAQAGHESQAFMRLTENLNYSAAGLMRTWPNRFDAETAARYEKRPEAIANRAYANRYGNGSEASGDGWKWRGRGWFQLTFKDNYMAFATSCKRALDTIPAYIMTTKGACHSAMWFYNNKKLNALADAGKIDEISERVNGGDHGKAERRALYNKLLPLLT